MVIIWSYKRLEPILAAVGPWLLVGALLSTLGLGAWLRWSLAGAVPVPWSFSNLRHAHSHLGYFAVLFPVVWYAWRLAGAEVPSARVARSYQIWAWISVFGFAHAGYGPVAIAGSTSVAIYWLWSVRTILPRVRQLDDPLGAVPFGLVLSLLCVPAIAIFLRRDPVFAHAMVATFLSSLLMLVVLPSVFAASGVRAGPWPVLLGAGVLGALYLGPYPSVVTRVGLFLYGMVLLAPVATAGLAYHLRTAWLLVAGGMMALALGIVPNTRPVALGAIHFLILGPVLSGLGAALLRRGVPTWAWWFGHGVWGSMSAALVVQGMGGGAWTAKVAAVAGTGVVLWWCTAVAWGFVPNRAPPASTVENRT